MEVRAGGVSAVGGGSPRGGYTLALSVLASVFFMWGFCTVLNDVLAPHLKAVFELNYTQSALVQFTFFAAYFIMSMPSAKVIETIGYKASIMVGLGIMALGALLFVPSAALPSFPVFLCAQFVLATGVTLLQVAANPYVAVIGKPETAPARLNLVQALNSLGDTVAPWFGGLLILAHSTSGNSRATVVLTASQKLADAGAVKLPYVGIAVVLLALAAVIFVTHLPKLQAQTDETRAAGASLWRHRRLMMGVVGIFLYVGAEVAVGTYLINYIRGPSVGNMTPAQAAGYLTYFWMGLMLGRFAGAFLMRYVRPATLLAYVGAGAMALVFATMLTTGAVAMWTIILVGLCNSIMFPTIFTLAIEGLGPLTEKGSGLLVMAICGGGVLPEVMGVLADHIGLKYAFIAPALCYVFILYFALYVRARPIVHAPAIGANTAQALA
ncbi:MAG: sugar MFS transporter [Caulobacteraceae bacterium]